MVDLGPNVNNSQSLTVSSYCFLLETNDVMYWSQVKQMFSYISLLYWFFGKIQHIGKHTNTRTKLFVDKHYMNWIVALFESRKIVLPHFTTTGGNSDTNVGSKIAKDNRLPMFAQNDERRNFLVNF